MPELVPFCLGLLFGLWFGAERPIYPLGAFAAGTGLLIAVTVLRRRRQFALLLILFAAFFLGWGRTALDGAGLPADDVSYWNEGGDVTVSAQVMDEPEARGSFRRFEVRVVGVRGDGTESTAGGRVLVDAGLEYLPAAGDLVDLTGRLQTPPSFATFDYREYLSRQGIGSTMRFPTIVKRGVAPAIDPEFLLKRFRAHVVDVLGRALPDPAAGLAIGLLVGGRASLSPEVAEDFARTGTSHILAVSGFNVSVVAGVAIFAFLPIFGRRRAVPFALTAIGLFTAVTGAAAAAVRAAAMGSLYLVAMLFGRQRNPFYLLLLAVALQSAVTPTLFSDVGFQLSVAATAGILFLVPPMLAFAERRPEFQANLALRAIVATGATTFSAFVATFPIIALTFRSISLIAIPANLLVTPFVVPAMAASFVLAMIGTVAPDLARLAAPVALLFLQPMLALASFLSRLPLASVRVGDVSTAFVAAYYLILLAFLARTRLAGSVLELVQRVRWKMVRAPALAGIACIVWSSAFAGGPSGTIISFFDLGGDRSSLIKVAGGRTVLVDAGNPVKLLNALGEELPIAGGNIDVLVITSWKTGDLGGVRDLVRRYDVGMVVAPPAGEFTPGGGVRAALIERHISYRIVEDETRISLAPGAGLLLLPRADQTGIDVLYRERRFSAFWDSGGSPENIGTNPEGVSVLHTHEPDTRWIRALSPAAVVAAPRPGAALAGGGYSLFRTDRDGTVHIEVGPDSMRVFLRKR